MFAVDLICVGGLKERFWKEACAEYEKRLGGRMKIRLTELEEEHLPARPSPAAIQAALEKEAARIRSRLRPGAYTVALCIDGERMDSEAFARFLGERMTLPGELTFLIGGSHGMADGLIRQARLRLSFSPMTFPHMIARVLLYEQLYRGVSILEGSRYHK